MLFRKMVLGVVAFGMGILLGAADFIVQKARAGEGYGTAEYMVSLIDRFDGAQGPLGVVFRRSMLVTAALPAAPLGWEAHDWASVSYDGLFSREQQKAMDRHLVFAAPDLTYLDNMGQHEARLLDIYLDDVSRVYLADDSYLDLRVSVDGYGIGSAAWARYQDEVDAYFTHVSAKRSFARIQGLDWEERIGPVEKASDGDLPHDLRRFHAEMDGVRIDLVTRAPEGVIRRFLGLVNLRDLRRLGGQTAPVPAPARADPQPDLLADLSFDQPGPLGGVN
ncbi:hypothetical protein [Thetidibacter halocola]|uniref:Uncharacterized protein n=1 Tax=Thetidibacter halocola TaxID=2827239 RepID=A0A8J7WGI5_9RHOB|nr:hypothetical protein [Thetidibacter halocola]MBS0125271.1 hypothetical protein [Thetidibacter halocola]